jgi:hypothetical protein
MNTSLDDQIRQVLQEDAHALKAPADLWHAIEARLDREPLRAAPKFRFPVERPWRTAVAVSSVAAAVWFLVVPSVLPVDTDAGRKAVADTVPVVMPVAQDVQLAKTDEGQQPVVSDQLRTLALK